MKRIIALPYLAAELAEKNNVSADLAERYLHALTELVSEAISHGEQVRIKGLGIFAIAASGDVTFTPDQSLADSVNAPFAAFEPMPLADGVELDETTSQEVIEEPAEPRSEDVEVTGEVEEKVPVEEEVVPPPYLIPKEPEEPATEEAPKKEDEVAEQLVPKEEDEVVAQLVPKEEDKVVAQLVPVEEDEVVEELIPEEPEEPAAGEAPVEPEEPTAGEAPAEPEEPVYYDNEIPERHYPWVWTVIGLVCGIIIGFAAGYFMQPKVDEWIAGDAAEVTETQPAPVDSLPENADTTARDTVAAPVAVPAEPAKDVVVYDTIRSTRFLTTMARQHYGRMEYWVYIYQENADILGHPDRAKAGTVVCIPDIKKYVTSESDSVNVARARAKAVEIYAPYR